MTHITTTHPLLVLLHDTTMIIVVVMTTHISYMVFLKRKATLNQRLQLY